MHYCRLLLIQVGYREKGGWLKVRSEACDKDKRIEEKA